jgi:hypothetical protein
VAVLVLAFIDRKAYILFDNLCLSIFPTDDQYERAPSASDLPYLHTCGRAFGTVELRVVDEAGEDVPADGVTVGELLAAGETVFNGYLEEAAFQEGGAGAGAGAGASSSSSSSSAFAGEWFRTGDLAVRYPGGHVSVVDRKKDMLLVGGENVYSSEVEAALLEHSRVRQAAVFGTPVAVMGEAVNAALVLKPGEGEVTAREIMDFVAARLAYYKVPSRVHFLTELPTTGSGKVLKTELRRRFAPPASLTDTGAQAAAAAPAAVAVAAATPAVAPAAQPLRALMEEVPAPTTWKALLEDVFPHAPVVGATVLDYVAQCKRASREEWTCAIFGECQLAEGPPECRAFIRHSSCSRRRHTSANTNPVFVMFQFCLSKHILMLSFLSSPQTCPAPWARRKRSRASSPPSAATCCTRPPAPSRARTPTTSAPCARARGSSLCASRGSRPWMPR